MSSIGAFISACREELRSELHWQWRTLVQPLPDLKKRLGACFEGCVEGCCGLSRDTAGPGTPYENISDENDDNDEDQSVISLEELQPNPVHEMNSSPGGLAENSVAENQHPVIDYYGHIYALTTSSSADNPPESLCHGSSSSEDVGAQKGNNTTSTIQSAVATNAVITTSHITESTTNLPMKAANNWFRENFRLRIPNKHIRVPNFLGKQAPNSNFVQVVLPTPGEAEKYNYACDAIIIGVACSIPNHKRSKHIYGGTGREIMPGGACAIYVGENSGLNCSKSFPLMVHGEEERLSQRELNESLLLSLCFEAFNQIPSIRSIFDLQSGKKALSIVVIKSSSELFISTMTKFLAQDPKNSKTRNPAHKQLQDKFNALASEGINVYFTCVSKKDNRAARTMAEKALARSYKMENGMEIDTKPLLRSMVID